MPSDIVREQAERVAARVDANAVGFDPATIIMILSTVIPLIANCFNRDDEPDPDEVNASVKKMHASHPKALRRRTARRIRRESEEPMSMSQAEILAEAVIAEACESAPESVAAFVRAVSI